MYRDTTSNEPDYHHKLEIQKLYSRIADVHDLSPSGYWVKGYRSEEQLVLSAIQCPGRLLDVGSGTGRYISLLNNRGFEIVAVDLSCPMISIARTKLPDNGSQSKIDFCLADAVELPFCAGSMDYVLCMGCLEFLPDKSQLLACFRELKRVTSTNGTIVCSGTLPAHELFDLSSQVGLRIETFTGVTCDGGIVDAYSAVSELAVLIARVV